MRKDSDLKDDRLFKLLRKIYEWLHTFMPMLTSEVHVSHRGECRKEETGGVTKPGSMSISTQSNPYLYC